MAWGYSQALRAGDEVVITLREPTSGRSTEIRLVRMGPESESAFVARGQTTIAGSLRVLNRQFAAEVDVTNIFRPGPTDKP